MEALSPRSINIQTKQRAKRKDAEAEEAKKAEAARKAQKEKEYAPPPPEWVIQPPITDGALAEKFRTGRLLGKGGFAVCYEGELRSRRHGAVKKSIFALKIVRSKMSQKKMEEKFRTELQIHAKMRHPNIVEFFRAFTFKESTFVVLELCSNGSVMDMVKKRKHLSLPEVRRFTVQLCGAIKYMHARNVIHRDLKMGNLFLDHEMNIKIGDFGLAAVLVSKDEVQGLLDSAKHRRTTLCGTPNYIAPEILEKGKGGHDHKVDIWAIGVIVFAMIAGQPPFQSSSQSEIYRRAKSVEYAWPEEGKNGNEIPPEAKDLVARLLKVDANERPGPDEVIGHPFFSMHGGNALPATMEQSCRYESPEFLNLDAKPRGDVMWGDAKRLSLRRLAKHCGVGILPGDNQPQAPVGADTSLSLYMECLAEEQAGTSPIVPLPHDFVYVSKFPSSVWPSLQESVSEEPVPLREVTESPQMPEPSSHLIDTKHRATERPRRAPVQSHAATLRAAHAGANPEGLRSGSAESAYQKGGDHLKETVGAPSRRRGLITDLPVRPSATTLSSNEHSVEPKQRATRSKKAIVIDGEPDDGQLGEQRSTKSSLTADSNVKGAFNTRPGDVAANTRARIASNVQSELGKAPRKERKPSQMEASRQKTTTTTPSINALIGPNEAWEQVTNSQPHVVLQTLRGLHHELDTSLRRPSRSKKSSGKASEIEAKSKCFKTRPVVVKWVDYTNKFGIGYILANGAVGCVFKGDGGTVPTCVIVPEAESHFKKRNSISYSDRHQLVSKRGCPVEFIENCGIEGLKRVLVSPSQYQIKVSNTGVADRLGPGFDVYDFEKRKKLYLWDKFGKYMTQTLGKGDDSGSAANNSEEDDEQGTRSHPVSSSTCGPFVKFYQRLGNVGIWGFGDGSFQFNFPDHTKLVVSNDGGWLDFYHLPVSAARALRAGETLNSGALAERSVLCYPTEILLGGSSSYRGHEFADLVESNELRQKVEFVRDVVGAWISAGGLGVMGEGGAMKGIKWEGMREKGGKLVWVTVGASGGDGRYEMPGTGGA